MNTKLFVNTFAMLKFLATIFLSNKVEKLNIRYTIACEGLK